MGPSKPVQLESRYIPDTSGQAGLRAESRQARTYRVGLNAMRLGTAPTPHNKFTPDLSGGSKPRCESVYLFLDFTTDLESWVILPKQRNRFRHQPHGFRAHSHNAADRNLIASNKKCALRLSQATAVSEVPPSIFSCQR